MGIYIIFFLIFMFFSVFDFIKIDDFTKKVLIFFLFIISSLFIGTRTMGPDYTTYHSFYLLLPKFQNLFSEFKYYTIISKFEPLYILTTGIFKAMNISFPVFHLIFTTAFCALFYFTITKYTKYAFTASLIYISFAYLSGWSAIRQFMAASIFFYAIQFLLNKRYLKYCILILIALLFHYSAIFLMLFVFVKDFWWNRSTYLMLIVGALLLYFSGLLAKISSFVFSFFPFLDSGKVDAWILNNQDGIISTIFLLWISIILFILLNLNKFRRIKNFNFYFNIYIFSLIAFIILSSLGGFGRVNMFFKLLHPIIFSYLFYIIDNKSKFILFLLIMFISFVTYYRTFVIMDRMQEGAEVKNTKFIPYKSWLIE